MLPASRVAQGGRRRGGRGGATTGPSQRSPFPISSVRAGSPRSPGAPASGVRPSSCPPSPTAKDQPSCPCRATSAPRRRRLACRRRSGGVGALQPPLQHRLRQVRLCHRRQGKGEVK